MTKKQNVSAPTANTNLRLDWCSHEAAKYAVEHWHYSKRLPVFKVVRVGVWENEKFIGVVIFSLGISKDRGVAYGLPALQVCELARVALTAHQSPVSKILSIAIKMLKKQSPGLRLIVSFADPHEGHNGGIYQAGNWVYTGHQANDPRSSCSYYKSGRRFAWREVSTQLMKHPNLPKTIEGAKKLGFNPTDFAPKHKYLMPLDADMKAKIEPLRKPYPKRAGSADSCTSANHAEGGGANPTSALNSE